MKKIILYSGIMTSYVCSAECRHCLYCSSPKAGNDFIKPETSESVAETLRRENVQSVHIGGGEPFLHMESLYGLLHALQKNHIRIDYIETNAFWCRDMETVCERLSALHTYGVHTVMVSVDPFHIEYIPLSRPLLLISALEKSGMDYFVWQEKFLNRLSRLDQNKIHTQGDLKLHLGSDYLENTLREYGLNLNGRALIIAGQLYQRKPAEMFCSEGPCSRLLDGLHCHIDLYGNYIPAGCPGISVALDDYFSDKLSDKKYPAVIHLLQGGVGLLLNYAAASGFIPSDKGYVNKCELCFFIRDHLRKTNRSYDVGPDCFYNSMLASYAKAEI